MKLHAPFAISARLLPALRIGDAWLSLEGLRDRGERVGATFILDFADGTEYTDDSLQSGCNGFRSTVETFETFLAFMSAAAESRRYFQRTGIDNGEPDMFPTHVMEWCADHASDIECAAYNLQDENGNVRAELIED